MFSYPQISRWLSFPIDPITVEDWLANRETFGPVESLDSQDEELEKAYILESEKDKDRGAKSVYEFKELLLIRAMGLAVCVIGNEKPRKIKIGPSAVVIRVPKDLPVKLKVSGKGQFSWEGIGEKKIIIEPKLS